MATRSKQTLQEAIPILHQIIDRTFNPIEETALRLGCEALQYFSDHCEDAPLLPDERPSKEDGS